MKRFFKSEIGAAILWVIATLVLAAAIFPWLYSAGQDFSEYAKSNELPAFLESLGKSCSKAKPGRYFNRSLLISAVIALPFLIRRIRNIRNADTSLVATKASISLMSKLSQLVTAFVIAGSILWFTGVLLSHLGAYTPGTNHLGFSKIITKAMMPAIGASLIEEWIFRGLLLGLWLRYTRPMTACVGSALLFSFLHFLQPPVAINDPSHLLAGFNLLAKTLLHFTNPEFFVTTFTTLTLVGLILAWARVKTGGLWFCFGLHAGWVFTFKIFSLLYHRVPDHWLVPWGVSKGLRAGIFPLLALVITAVVCHFVLTKFFSQPSARAKAADS